MRTPSYSVHQGLTPDATAIVKAAITLARRRGHAQVTPLHVATAMMGASTGLLRSACLRAHSHPLQCKALELCFNVALNRLPTSIILGPSTHHHHPCFSNALIAAFKRAQAHQRRGSVENQQQPILALKIEHEQLVISILDDPSVSRVMREAGFSSPHVKKNVEQSVSLEISSSSYIQNHSLVKTEHEHKETIKPVFQLTLNKSNDYMNSVLDSIKQRNNTVIVAEDLGDAESIMRGVMGKLDRGDERFVSVPLSFRNMSIEDVQQRIGELRSLVNGYQSKWVVLYLGDLKWVSEFWSNYGELRRNHYSPVELMIMEISRLLCGVGEKGKNLSLMGIADLQTYLRCKIGHPSLETLWQLHPLTVPVSSLGLSLNLDSDLQRNALGNEHSSWLMKTRVEKNLNCCSDCTANYKREAWSIEMSTSNCSSLPSWLKSYKEDQNKRKTISDQDFDKLKDLCKKWNSICRSVHKQPHFLESAVILSSSSPSSSSSVSSHDKNKKRLHETISTWPLNKQKPELLSNPNSSPNSAACSEANDEDNSAHEDGYAHSFKDFNSENLKALSKGLEKKVPWHKDIIPDISSTVLECRSGMVVRREGSSNFKEETWLSFLGVDQNGKEKIGKELARIVFGSYNNFVAIGGSIRYSDDSINEEYCMIKKKKRMSDQEEQPGSSYLDRFVEAVKENPSRVFFMEDVDKVDHISQMGIKKAIESGRISSHVSDGEFVSLKDAIVIFSCDSFSSMSRPCSPVTGEIQAMKDGFCGPLDLNVGATEEDDDEDYSVSRIGGIMDIIDRQIIFKIQVL